MSVSTIKKPLVLHTEGVVSSEVFLQYEGQADERLCYKLYLSNGGYFVVRISTKRAELIVDYVDVRGQFSRNTIVSPD